MKINALHTVPHIDKVMIHSLESNLYQVSVLIQGQEHYVTDHKGKILHSHNKLALQALFDDLTVDEMVLSHVSAYDEMIGLPSANNRLEVPLSR
ncbi:hypothetical protein CBF23_001155 [Marinomonas agarivorans]|nr:hypothetical protein CBF23_001155 [Marinomonas agarivorans]